MNIIRKINNYLNKYVDTIIQITFILFIFSTSITIVGYFSLHENETIPMIIKYIRFLSYGMCVLIIIYNLINKKYSKKTLIIFSVLFVLAIIYNFISLDLVLVKPLLLSFAIYKTDINKLIKETLIVQLVILFGTIFLAKLNIIESITVVDRNRDFLGFAYASFSSFYYLFTVLLYINYRKNKLSYIEITILAFINIVLYIYTDTKNSFFITSVVLLVSILIKLFPNIKKVFINLKINRYIPILCMLLVLVLTLCPQNSLWYSLNNLVSGRLMLGRNALNNFGISLFGSNVKFIGYDISNMHVENYGYVDSSYISYMIRYGILNLSWIILIYIALINRSMKEKDVYMLLAAVTISIVGIFDPYLYDLPFNVFPVIAFGGFDLFDSLDLKSLRNKKP